MATVTGLTAAKILELMDEQIIEAAIVGDNLILTTRGGTLIDVGVVVGDVGPQGPVGPEADFAGYTEPVEDLGSVSGAVDIDFAVANVFKINPTGAIVVTFLNLPVAGEIAPGTLIVANSTYAITWPAGTDFPDATPPVLDGKTFISMVAESTQVTVGRAWGAVA